MTNKSITDVAFECMKRKRREVPFNKLWQEVSLACGFDDSLARKKIGQFYNAITLDARFISLPDNKWDLKMRHTYNETRIDTSAIMLDDDDDDDELSDFDEDGNEEFEQESNDEY